VTILGSTNPLALQVAAGSLRAPASSSI
jgi:hypothetical protein